jgi:hypothetical protein
MTHRPPPPRPRDTRSLLGSLAVALVVLALLMATSCAPIPRAVIVDTTKLEDTTASVARSSAQLGEGVQRVSDAHDRASGKADELIREIEAVRGAVGITPDLRAAFDRQVRLGAELAQELAAGKVQIRSLKKLKADNDRDILALQLVVGDLTSDVAAANKAAKALEKQADSGLKAKEKLAWWRWRYAPASIVFTAALLVWILRKPLMRLLGIPAL